MRREQGQGAHVAVADLDTPTVDFSNELRLLASTLDRVDHIGEICQFIDELVKGQSQAGVLLLCGSAEHAISELALRMAYLAHDPLWAPRKLARGRVFQPTGGGMRPFMIGESLAEDMKAWIASYVDDDDDSALEKALHAASGDGDLWILTFRITASRTRQLSRVEAHLEQFAKAFDRALRSEARLLGRAKFLIVYCVECEASQAELLSGRQQGFGLQPAKVMREWPAVSGQDFEEWFDLIEEELATKPALRHVDLAAARIDAIRTVFGAGATGTANMFEAIEALRTCLTKHRRTSAAVSEAAP